MRINMNHAATSPSKPQAVVDAITRYLNQNDHQSVGRGGDELASMRALLESRLALMSFFGAHDPSHVVFTSGATESLNMAINGLVRDGCHVLISGFEHNAVTRPLERLQKLGRIEVTTLPCRPGGGFDPDDIKPALRPNTRLLIMTHASNVLGNILPIRESFAIAKQHGLLTLLDAAQTAGHLDVRLDDKVDLIAFTGHKGLRGVAGSGGLILNEAVVDELLAWKAGGTGSYSQSFDMPDFLPDKLEPGTPNMLGILGLHAAINTLNETGLANLRAREKELTSRFMEGLRQLPLTVYGEYSADHWVPVISLNIPQLDAGLAARLLNEKYGIETRSGLHCSPLAHKTIGTFPYGTLRFSFGADTTNQELEFVLTAVKKLCRE